MLSHPPSRVSVGLVHMARCLGLQPRVRRLGPWLRRCDSFTREIDDQPIHAFFVHSPAYLVVINNLVSLPVNVVSFFLLSRKTQASTSNLNPVRITLATAHYTRCRYRAIVHIILIQPIHILIALSTRRFDLLINQHAFCCIHHTGLRGSCCRCSSG